MTLLDSSADGSGKVENTNANGYAVYSNKSLTITGGTFTSTAKTYGTLYINGTAKISKTDGGEGPTVINSHSSNSTAITVSSLGSAVISAGTFSSDVSDYCAAGTYAKQDENASTYTVTAMTQDIAVASVTTDTETLYFSGLNAAVAYALSLIHI